MSKVVTYLACCVICLFATWLLSKLLPVIRELIRLKRQKRDAFSLKDSFAELSIKIKKGGSNVSG